jgi:hypothetical protein
MDDPDARQPYHVVTEQDERRGMKLVRRTTQMARTSALAAVRRLVDEAEGNGWIVGAMGIVVGSNVNPATIPHPHIRAHAMEGRLYRDAVEASASASGLRPRVLVERDAYGAAAATLGRTVGNVKSATAALGRPPGGPWSAQEKLAALAAWVALAEAQRPEGRGAAHPGRR